LDCAQIPTPSAQSSATNVDFAQRMIFAHRMCLLRNRSAQELGNQCLQVDGDEKAGVNYPYAHGQEIESGKR